MKRSFPAVITGSFFVFRKTFLSLSEIYLGASIIIVILGFLISLFAGNEILAYIGEAGKNISAINHLPQKSMLAFAGALIVTGIIYFSCFWVVLVIKNEILYGQILIKDSFFDLCKRIWKLLAFTLLFGVTFRGICLIMFLLLKSFAFLLIIPLAVFIFPMFIMCCYGFLCQKGSFPQIILHNISLAYNSWKQIMINLVLFHALTGILIIVIMLIQSVWTMLHFYAIVDLINILFTLFMFLCVPCFYTVLYVNFANIKPQNRDKGQNSAGVFIQNS